MIGKFKVLAYTGDNETGVLLVDFCYHDVRQKHRVVIVQMAYGFICQQEVEWLGQGTHHGYPLLLSDAHLPHGFVDFVRYAQLLKPLVYFFWCLMMGYAVFDVYVLPCGELRKQPQFLEKHTDVALSDRSPLLLVELEGILVVKKYLAGIVTPIPHEIAA